MASSLRRVAAASLVGTTIEWYDFFIYGSASALVLGKLFFPSFSPVAGTLASLGTFAVGFLARPIGGVVMGHFGDRVGRKSALVTCLLVMGVSTVGIGLLPGYATIGVWAPILLVVLRFAQGFGVGGEMGGAVLILTEHAPPGRRARYGSIAQLGVPLGTILANGVFLVLSAALPTSQFEAWGWRIPFLASVVLIAVGLFIRLRIEESPVFRDAVTAKPPRRVPAVEVLRHHPRPMLLAAGAFLGLMALGTVYAVYTLTYATKVVHFDRTTVLALIMVGSVAWIGATMACATLADRIGRRRVYLASLVAQTVWCLAFLPLIGTGSVAALAGALLVLGIIQGAANGAHPAMFAELFPTEVRYSGVSLSYQTGAVLGGGLAPVVAELLYSSSHTAWPITVYLVAMSVLAVVCTTFLPETVHRDLRDTAITAEDVTSAPVSPR